MIKSMTGYGSAKGNVDGLEITVELKSGRRFYQRGFLPGG